MMIIIIIIITVGLTLMGKIFTDGNNKNLI
jgi:hypothetical protein